MTSLRPMSRRMAIAEMGKAGLAIVVFGAAACSTETSPTTTGPGDSTTTLGGASSTTPGTSTSRPSGSTTTQPTGLAFHRVNLDFVSAYILYRSGEAALVDTGVSGSTEAIASALAEVSVTWDQVGHVILTHQHPDHVGSIDGVLEQAPGAAVYAGAADIPGIASAVTPQPVGDGDRVFDLDIIETPGHTAGHISVLDAAAGILVAGDALNGEGGTVAGPNPSFSDDMDVANASVRKLAEFEFEIALFGHGEPVLDGASAAVAALGG